MENKDNKIEEDAVVKALQGSKMDAKSESFNIWKCLECEGEPEFEHGEFMKHLQDVHGIDTKTAKGSRTMLMHLDGRKWYQSNYEVVVQGVKCVNFCRNRRARNDPMRFDE